MDPVHISTGALSLPRTALQGVVEIYTCIAGGGQGVQAARTIDKRPTAVVLVLKEEDRAGQQRVAFPGAGVLVEDRIEK